ncbi:MAG: helix-turn-helix domain-containing protein [Actinomycetota bacterium]|nr:helix-turn-helix domain-containing protein [Actinomycetota bacterium]
MLLDLDAVASAQVAVALERFAADMRARGVVVAADLVRLSEACRRRATQGQRVPPSAAAVAGSENGGESLLVTVEEAGRMLSVSSRTVKRMVSDGRLPSVLVGGARRVRRADLDEYVRNLNG